MSFPLASKKTILLLSDEFLHIYTAGGGGVSLVDTVNWGAENFEQTVIKIITKRCGGRPVIVLNDMVEQHYRKEKIIKSGVNAMDKKNIVRRKLAVAFSGYPVRAAYPLKEKIKKTTNQMPADIYIFAALPGSEQLNKTMTVVRDSYLSMKGLCLLPVESSDMVRALSLKLSKTKEAKAKWCVFVGQHKNGGLRQIVTKNGELALTRMTPITDTETDMHRWVSEVDQELKATMSYLSRFGYTQEDGVDVVVISNADAGALLSDLIGETVNFHALTVSEAARLLNISIGRQESQRYADPLHLAWIARKNQLILPMRAQKIDEVVRPRQMAMVASILMFLSAACLGYMFVNETSDLSTLNTKLNEAKTEKSNLDVEYEKEVARNKEMGVDITLLQSSVLVYEELERNRIDSLEVFKGVGNALGQNFPVDRVEIAPYEEDISKKFTLRTVGQREREDKAEPLYQTTLQMTFPSTTDIETGNKEVQDLSERLKVTLPAYQIEVSKLLKDYEYTEDLVIEAGALEKEDLTQDFVAQIQIRGPMKEVK